MDWKNLIPIVSTSTSYIVALCMYIQCVSTLRRALREELSFRSGSFLSFKEKAQQVSALSPIHSFFASVWSFGRLCGTLYIILQSRPRLEPVSRAS